MLLGPFQPVAKRLGQDPGSVNWELQEVRVVRSNDPPNPSSKEKYFKNLGCPSRETQSSSQLFQFSCLSFCPDPGNHPRLATLTCSCVTAVEWILGPSDLYRFRKGPEF